MPMVKWYDGYMINPEIAKLMIGLSETEAKAVCKSYRGTCRVILRDGLAEVLPDDRNDKRYSLILKDGLVVRVVAG